MLATSQVVYSPNYTCLVMSRHDAFDTSSPCIFAMSSLLNSMARLAGLDVLDTSNVSWRVKTWCDEPSGIWA